MSFLELYVAALKPPRLMSDISWLQDVTQSLIFSVNLSGMGSEVNYVE